MIDRTQRGEQRLATLLTTLELAVPMHIAEVRTHSEEWRAGEARRCADVIAAHGDHLQFGGKYCAATFNAVARGLALGACQPGGVTYHGKHWCLDHDACTQAERDAHTFR